MSIYQVKEIPGGSGKVNERGETEYVRKFQVITTAAGVGSATVRTATGIPRRGDTYATSTEFDRKISTPSKTQKTRALGM